MNRSLNLIRPFSATSRGLSTHVRPMSLALRPQPSTPIQAGRITIHGLLLRRAYASKPTSDAENQSKANHHVDPQNATSSAAEEVSPMAKGARDLGTGGLC